MDDLPKYRPNVAVILQNNEGRILVCERLDVRGAWQFPQGGICSGETDEEALEREMMEELNLGRSHYRILEKRGPYRYLLGKGRKKKGYDGQEQHYFRVLLTGPVSEINVDTAEPEFRSYRWIEPSDFNLRWLPQMKREVYCAVLKDFFNIDPQFNNGEREELS